MLLLAGNHAILYLSDEFKIVSAVPAFSPRIQRYEEKKRGGDALCGSFNGHKQVYYENMRKN